MAKTPFPLEPNANAALIRATIVAFHRARAAFSCIEDAPPAESRPATGHDANWASRYLVY